MLFILLFENFLYISYSQGPSLLFRSLAVLTSEMKSMCNIFNLVTSLQTSAAKQSIFCYKKEMISG